MDWGGEVTDFWPVSYSFFWLIKYIFGESAVAFHIANVIAFALSTIFLFFLLNELKIKTAFWIALLYCLHPMNVELVAWAFQAKTNLANAIMLLSMIYLVKYLKNDKVEWFGAAVTFFIFSLLAKASLIMMPFLISIFIFVFEKEKKMIKKIQLIAPFFLISLILGIVNIAWYKNDDYKYVNDLILEKDYIFRFLLVGKTYFFYLLKSFLPFDMMFFYPRWSLDIKYFWSYFPLVFLLCLIGLSLYFIFIKKNYYFFGIIASFTILFPALGFFEIYYMRYSFVADHWLGLGIVAFIAPLIVYLSKYGKWANATFILIAILFSTLSYNHLQNFSSEKKLFEHSLQRSNSNLAPYNLLGVLYKNEGKFEEAISIFHRSLEITPNAEAHFNLASIYQSMGQIHEAERHFLSSLNLNPLNPRTFVSLGVLYARNNRLDQALHYLQKAIETDDKFSQAYYNLGYFYELQGSKELGLKMYEKALQLEPTNEIFKKAFARLSELI